LEIAWQSVTKVSTLIPRTSGATDSRRKHLMRRPPPKRIWGAALLAALALGGCGSGSGDPRAAAVPRIELKSPAFATDALPARYTCDGRNISPPLEWGAVPTGAGQLALYLVGFTPDTTTGRYHLSIEWAVAGLNPALHRLAAGQLPPQAYLGVASDGKRQRYSICPKRGVSVHYQFEVYGVPAGATISRRFAGLSVLESLTARNSPTRADGHGGFVALYERK
jgi:phosphatidylethanolamine-binding protein (PEBP) family uncharacterized protein